MDDLRLRENLRTLAKAIHTPAALEAERKVREGFRDDGNIERRIVAGVIPLLRLDWVVSPSATAGVHDARFLVPEDARADRLAMVSTANVTSTFGVDVLISGEAKGSGAIRVGMSRANGVLSTEINAGSVVSIETKTSIPQGVTVSLFYRPSED